MRYQKALKVAIMGLIICFLIPLAVNGATIFEDNFNSYNNGSLVPQGGWQGGSQYYVQDSIKYEGAKAVVNQIAPSSAVHYDGAELSTGKAIIYIKSPNDDSTFLFGLAEDNEANAYVPIVCQNNGICYCVNTEGSYVIIGTYPDNEWFYLSIEWRDTDHYARYSIDGTTTTEWLPTYLNGWVDGLNIIEIWADNDMGAGVFYFDTLGENPVISEPYITATAPATGSTITATSDTLTIDYFNINSPYTGFSIAFLDNIIESNSQSILFNTTGSGTEVISLDDFGIATNGHWDLKGLAFGTHLDIEDQVFLTTRGYVDFFSEDLVDPPYYLIFNVAGLPSPYEFASPSDWYATNVERFDAPTAFFTNFVSLVNPIFLKVAEFGRQLEPIFNKNEAYDRGYALGEIFPIIGAYVKAIDIFFGGFPIVGFLVAIILVMLGIFVFRTIMKFIPFVGG